MELFERTLSWRPSTNNFLSCLTNCFLLSKMPYPSSPLFLTLYHSGWKNNYWMEYQPKSNEKYVPFLHCISSFEGSFYKKV